MRGLHPGFLNPLNCMIFYELTVIYSSSLQLGFSDEAKNGTIFSKNIMVSKMVAQVFRQLTLLFLSMCLACVRAT